jgi:hypothetical protein
MTFLPASKLHHSVEELNLDFLSSLSRLTTQSQTKGETGSQAFLTPSIRAIESFSVDIRLAIQSR